jgi:hypothetical protein
LDTLKRHLQLEKKSKDRGSYISPEEQQYWLKQMKQLSVSSNPCLQKSTKGYNNQLIAEENNLDQKKDDILAGYLPKTAVFHIISEKIPQIERNISLMMTLRKKHVNLVQEATKATINDMKLDQVNQLTSIIWIGYIIYLLCRLNNERNY